MENGEERYAQNVFPVEINGELKQIIVNAIMKLKQGVLKSK